MKIPNHIEILLQKFTQSLGLPFRDLLPASLIQEALKAEKIQYRHRLFDPFVTLWTFLSATDLRRDKKSGNQYEFSVSTLVWP